MSSFEIRVSLKDKNKERFKKLIEGLKELDLSYASLSDEDIDMVCEVLVENDSVETLKLYLNQISCNGVTHLANLLLKNSRITEVDLGNNLIGSKGFENIIKNSASLVSLDVSNCGITDLSFLENASLKIHELILSENNFGDTGMNFISQVLETPNCSIQSLDCSRTRCTEKGIIQFSRSLGKNESLLFLGLNGTFRSSESSITELSKSLGTHPSIVRLDLNSTKIKDSHFSILMNELAKNKSLLTLSLGENLISDISPLTEYYSEKNTSPNPTLIQINLGKNSISKIEIFCETICENKHCDLNSLNFNGNTIGNNGIIYLSKILKNSNINIEELSISSTSVSDKGLYFLIQSLWNNRSLKKLNLSNNRVSGESLKNFLNLFENEEDCCLEDLNLRNNDDIYEEDIKLLEKSLEESKWKCKVHLQGKTYN